MLIGLKGRLGQEYLGEAHISLPEQLELSNSNILPDKLPDFFQKSDDLLEIFFCST